MWNENTNVASKITKFPNKFNSNEQDMKWKDKNNFGRYTYNIQIKYGPARVYSKLKSIISQKTFHQTEMLWSIESVLP